MKRIEKVFLLMLVLTCFFTSAQQAPQPPNDDASSLPVDPKTNCYVRYYYFPNLQAYFDNLKLVYYYKVKGEWQIAEELPPNYGGYSLYNNYRVTITDYDGDKPYQLIQSHKKMYPYNSKGRFTNQTASSD